MKDIKNVKLKFSCDADWNNMDAADGAKYCEQCQKKVYDFTDAKQYEFLAILSENNNNICGRFRPEQMVPVKSNNSAWKKWLSAAMVLIGINIFNNKADAQNVNHKTTQIKFPKPVPTVGDVETLRFDSVASFPAGIEAFEKFLKSNIHYKKDMMGGKAYVTFSVNPNGTLSNYRIMKSAGRRNDNEVIRVLKLSPKWKPATLKGKPVTSDYTIPVKFEK